MTKKRFIALYFAMMLAFTGCSKKPTTENESAELPKIVVENNNSNFDVSISGDETNEYDGSEEATEEISITREVKHYDIERQGEIKYNKDDDIFGLTDEEIKAYEDFSKDFDKSVFKGMAPLSIFKIWIQSGVAKAWETDYNMYEVSSTEQHNLTEQVFFNNYMDDLENESLTTRRQMAEFNFQNVENAEWVLEDENNGYLIFETDYQKWVSEQPDPDNIPFRTDFDDQIIAVHFVKTADDLWELSYYPISALDPSEVYDSAS